MLAENSRVLFRDGDIQPYRSESGIADKQASDFSATLLLYTTILPYVHIDSCRGSHGSETAASDGDCPSVSLKLSIDCLLCEKKYSMSKSTSRSL